MKPGLLLGKQPVLTTFPRYYLLQNKLSDWMIKQLLNSVIAKYRDLSVSRRSIICRRRRLRQITDLLATDKSRYFVQPHPIISKCLQSAMNENGNVLVDHKRNWVVVDQFLKLFFVALINCKQNVRIPKGWPIFTFSSLSALNPLPPLSPHP